MALTNDCTWQNENFIQNKYGYCSYTSGHGDGSTPMIFNLYVHFEYRRQGKAKKLLQYAINEIRETGYGGEIAVEADPREGSIDLDKLLLFYKSMGLKIIEGR